MIIRSNHVFKPADTVLETGQCKLGHIFRVNRKEYVVAITSTGNDHTVFLVWVGFDLFEILYADAKFIHHKLGKVIGPTVNYGARPYTYNIEMFFAFNVHLILLVVHHNQMIHSHGESIKRYSVACIK